MYVSAMGTDLVVSTADKAKAQAKITAIMKSNAALLKKFESDVAKYKIAVAARAALIAQIAKEQQAFKNASLSYNSQVASVQGSNSSNTQGYNAAMSAWSSAKKAYDDAVSQRTTLLSRQKQASDAVLSHVTPPPGYNGCATQADHDAWAKKCAQTPNVTVKGLGHVLFGLSGSDSAECLWTGLPVCVSIPNLPPDPGPQPTAPKMLDMPKKPTPPPKRTVPPEPVPPKQPKLAEVPHLVVRDDAPPLPPTVEQPKSFAVAGLLALVVVGGGAVYYFSTRKKKVA